MESFGIAAFRKEKTLELLMIKKRATYAFLSIAIGSYKKRNNLLSLLINNTSFLEKSILLEYNFEYIYYQAFGVNPSNLHFKLAKLYEKAKEKFYKTFTKDSLTILIKSAKSIEVPWEFPKGRLGKESTIECAKREFIEETGQKNFNLLCTSPVSVEFEDYSFIDNNKKKYKYTIYLASSYFDIKEYIFHSSSEISDIQWINPDKSKIILQDHLIFLYKKIIKKIKNYKKKNFSTFL